MKREGWIWIVGIVLVVGLLAGQPALVVLAGLVAVIGAVAWYWGRHSLDRVTYQRTLSVQRAFQGDVIQLDVVLTNAKPLPLPVVEIDDLLPEEFDSEFMPLAGSGLAKTKRLWITTSLGWYEQARWSYPVECKRRGLYRLGPTTLRSGDLFGLFPARREDASSSGLLVYPRLRSLTELGLQRTLPFGGNAGGDPLFTDPMRIKGMRDYAPGDPHYLVDWKATARVGQMQSRLLEPAASPQVLVFLDVDTFELSWEGTDVEVLEDAVSVAASVAYASAERRFSVGLFSNGTLAETEAPVRLRPSRHPDQVVQILELLARVTPLSSVPITDLLLEASVGVSARTFVFVVTGVARPELSRAGQRLRMGGIAASLIYVGRGGLTPEIEAAGWHAIERVERDDDPAVAPGVGAVA